MWASLVLAYAFLIPELEPLHEELDEYRGLFWAMWAVTILIPVFLIVHIGRRRNWARIAMLLFTVPGLAIYFVEAFQPIDESAWTFASGLFFMAMDLAALFLLFTGAGAKWFEQTAQGASPH